MLILVGSSQECGTRRNPLNIATRIKMLREIYGDSPNIMIKGIADLSTEDDISPEWGRYFLDNVDRYIYKKMAKNEYIDLFFDGNHVLYEEAKQHIPQTPY